MNGRERVQAILCGRPVDRPGLLPILHSGLASSQGVPLGDYLASALTMAQVTINGWQQFGLDGVQLSLGVTAEAQALGARIFQPRDGNPQLQDNLLTDLTRLDDLRQRDARIGGRMPLFFEAVQRVVRTIGAEAFVLITLRGPLLLASQLCGVQELLIATIEQPQAVETLLDYTGALALELGRWLLGSGAHGLVLGEATCSPSFIAPALYRRLVQPRHRQLVAGLKAAGWRTVGLHICGNTVPILEDIIASGVDFCDVDYQVPAATALSITRGRCALRGNLDPTADLFLGDPAVLAAKTERLLREVDGQRWIISSGCDIPPGTPAENLSVLAQTVRNYVGGTVAANSARPS
jgi:uroporphyrinogen decarboxylase